MSAEWRIRLAVWIASMIGGKEWVRGTLYFEALAKWVMDNHPQEDIDHIIAKQDEEWELYGF